jgi:hypothetical protein
MSTDCIVQYGMHGVALRGVCGAHFRVFILVRLKDCLTRATPLPFMNEEPLSVIIIQLSKDQDEGGSSRPSEVAEMSAPNQIKSFLFNGRAAAFLSTSH